MLPWSVELRRGWYVAKLRVRVLASLVLADSRCMQGW
jgi:hypothetical protein